MPTELVRRVDLDLIYPPFLRVALEVLARCKARGIDYVATYGYRSFKEQADLHARYKLGVGGKAAPAGSSAHNYGCAMDFCRDASDVPGLQPDWRTAAYSFLGDEAKAAGLVWGGSFGDAPHINWPGVTTGADMRPLLALVKGDDCSAVWKHLDSQRMTETWAAKNPRLARELARV